MNKLTEISLFLVEISGNTGRNAFLTSIASQKIFRPYFQKSRLEYYFLCLFYFSSPYSGHFRSNFVVLLLLLTARSRRTRKADQKCPEKQDKKSKRNMKTYLPTLKTFLYDKRSPLFVSSLLYFTNVRFIFPFFPASCYHHLRFLKFTYFQTTCETTEYFLYHCS